MSRTFSQCVRAYVRECVAIVVNVVCVCVREVVLVTQKNLNPTPVVNMPDLVWTKS